MFSALQPVVHLCMVNLADSLMVYSFLGGVQCVCVCVCVCIYETLADTEQNGIYCQDQGITSHMPQPSLHSKGR